MKKYLLAIAALLSLSISAYASESPVNIAGEYDCRGVEVGTNEKFTCLTTLEKTGETYSLKSSCDDGSSYLGTGIYQPDKHRFTVAFINPKKAEETGLSVSDVKNDYAISSTWTYLNKTEVAHCACSKRQSKTVS